jgi:hypothetical protein
MKLTSLDGNFELSLVDGIICTLFWKKNPVFAEELFCPNDATYSFDEQSRFVTRYKYEFYRHGELTTNRYHLMSEHLKSKMQLPSTGSDLKEGQMWRLGVQVFSAEATIVSEVDATKLSPPSADKGLVQYDYPGYGVKYEQYVTMGMDWMVAQKQTAADFARLSRDFWQPYVTQFGTLCTLNEMKVVDQQLSDLFVANQRHISFFDEP